MIDALEEAVGIPPKSVAIKIKQMISLKRMEEERQRHIHKQEREDRFAIATCFLLPLACIALEYAAFFYFSRGDGLDLPREQDPEQEMYSQSTEYVK
jgi:hypothetical protein